MFAPYARRPGSSDTSQRRSPAASSFPSYQILRGLASTGSQMRKPAGYLIGIEMMSAHIEMKGIIVEVLADRGGHGGMQVKHLESGSRQNRPHVSRQGSLVSVQF